MTFFGTRSRQHRNGDAHQVERIAWRIGGVVALVDAPYFVQVIQIAFHLVDINGRFQGHAALACRAETERTRESSVVPLHRVDALEDAGKIRGRPARRPGAAAGPGPAAGTG